MYLKYLKNGKKLMFIMLMLFFSPMALAQTQEQAAQAAQTAAETQVQAALEDATTEIRGLPAGQTVLASEIKAFNLSSRAMIAAQSAVESAATPAARIIALQNLTTLTRTATARAEAIATAAGVARTLNEAQAGVVRTLNETQAGAETEVQVALGDVAAEMAELPAGRIVLAAEIKAFNLASRAMIAAQSRVESAATPAARIIALQNLTTLTRTATATAEAIAMAAVAVRTLDEAQAIVETEVQAAIRDIRTEMAGLPAGQTVLAAEIKAFNAASMAMDAAQRAVERAPTLEARIIALQNLTTLTRTATERAEEVITAARAARVRTPPTRTAPNIDNYRWVGSPQVLRTSQIYGAGAPRQFCGNQDYEVCIGLADKTGAPNQLVKCFIPKNTTACPTIISAANNCFVATLQGL